MAASSRHRAELRGLKARIILRKTFKREPNSSEIEEYLRTGSNDSLSYEVIAAAFRAGEEVYLTFVYL